MARIVTLPLVAILALATPALGAPSDQTPYGLEDNAVGTLRWLPREANESPGAGAAGRLVVVYDHSIDQTGEPIPLMAKGPFGMKLFTASPDPRMIRHSDSVTSLDDLIDPQVGPVDQAFMGVAGDVRDGDCAKAGTESFSAAYTSTRTFFHPGDVEYTPLQAPGTCEVVDSSVPVTDAQGAVIGYDTTVTNHVPGFWVDIQWPQRSVPLFGSGYAGAEVWYGTLFDSDGEDGEWYTTGDTTSQSTSVGSPGDYDLTHRFTGNPGAFGPPCPGFPGPPASSPSDTYEDFEVEVPADATRVTFLLYPKGDWDLQVEDPNGNVGTSGNFGGLHEQEIVPSGGQNNIPELVPGTFTMRACNYTGETDVLGAVIIETPGGSSSQSI